MDKQFSISFSLYLYCLFIGTSYLFGFWIPFDLNILEFVDVLDIFKATLYPALPAVGLAIFYSTIDGLHGLNSEERDSIVKRGGVGKYYVYFQYILAFSFLIFIVGYGCYEIIIEEGYLKLKGAYILLAVFGITYFIPSKNIPIPIDAPWRKSLIIFVFFLPLYVYNQGNKHSKEIMDITYPAWTIESDSICNNPNVDLILITRLGGQYFGLNSHDKSICIFSSNNVRLERKLKPTPTADKTP